MTYGRRKGTLPNAAGVHSSVTQPSEALKRASADDYATDPEREGNVRQHHSTPRPPAIHLGSGECDPAPSQQRNAPQLPAGETAAAHRPASVTVHSGRKPGASAAPYPDSQARGLDVACGAAAAETKDLPAAVSPDGDCLLREGADHSKSAGSLDSELSERACAAQVGVGSGAGGTAGAVDATAPDAVALGAPDMDDQHETIAEEAVADARANAGPSETLPIDDGADAEARHNGRSAISTIHDDDDADRPSTSRPAAAAATAGAPERPRDSVSARRSALQDGIYAARRELELSGASAGASASAEADLRFALELQQQELQRGVAKRANNGTGKATLTAGAGAKRAVKSPGSSRGAGRGGSGTKRGSAAIAAGKRKGPLDSFFGPRKKP